LFALKGSFLGSLSFRPTFLGLRSPLMGNLLPADVTLVSFKLRFFSFLASIPVFCAVSSVTSETGAFTPVLFQMQSFRHESTSLPSFPRNLPLSFLDLAKFFFSRSSCFASWLVYPLTILLPTCALEAARYSESGLPFLLPDLPWTV